MTTTTRYAAIDLHSGYVWGAAYAPNPVAAAVQILSDADGSRRYAVTECGPRDAGASLDLYEIGHDLDITDGTDAATIAAVEDTGRYVATVRATDAQRDG